MGRDLSDAQWRDLRVLHNLLDSLPQVSMGMVDRDLSSKEDCSELHHHSLAVSPKMGGPLCDPRCFQGLQDRKDLSPVSTLDNARQWA